MNDTDKHGQWWVTGWNMPGYLPESEPEVFNLWEDALTFLREAIEQFWDEDGTHPDDLDISADAKWLDIHTQLALIPKNRSFSLMNGDRSLAFWIMDNEDFEPAQDVALRQDDGSSDIWTNVVIMAFAVTIAFLIGAFAPWDSLPWNQAPATHPIGHVISDDDPTFNCLTMGNLICGPTYQPVDDEFADTLNEGRPEFRDWTGCLYQVGPTTDIVCPDGYKETS